MSGKKGRKSKKKAADTEDDDDQSQNVGHSEAPAEPMPVQDYHRNVVRQLL
jgi:hypothetical protein